MAKIIVKELRDILQEDYLGYSLKSILDRAIVDIFDGLKPSQRRTLDTMKERKVYIFTKSANVEGAVMVRHPHGGVYPTMVKMAQKDYQNIPLLEGRGNFGNHTTQLTSAAAPRYTEIKLSKLGKSITDDIKQGYIDVIPNYDGTSWQSKVLPVKFPMCLTQYSSGTAVGYASTIFSYNLKELAEAITKWRLRGERTILYPDFATGGQLIKNEETMKKINDTGRGTIEVRGKVKIVNKQELEIVEIPHDVNREDIVDDIIDLVENGQFKEIIDVKDLSGFNDKTMDEELKIWVKIKKGVNPDMIIEKLYLKTRLSSKMSSNMTVLCNGDLLEVGVWDIIEEWYNWRKQCIINFTNLKISNIEKEINLASGIEIAKSIFDIEELLRIVRFNSEEESMRLISEKGDFNEEQLRYIANLKAAHFNEKWFREQIESIAPSKKKIKELKSYCKDDKALEKTILDDLNKIAKDFGIERNTQLVDFNGFEFKEEVLETLKDNGDYHIVVSKDGYIYKFKTQNDNPKLKPNDEIKYKTVLNNQEGTFLVFNPKENFAKRIKVSEIPVTERNDIGTFAGTFVDYKPLTVIPVDDNVQFYLNVYKEGRIVKVNKDSYKGQQGIKQQNDKLTLLDCIAVYDKGLNIEVISEKGKQRKIELDPMTTKKDRTGQGVIALEDIKEFKLI